MSKNLIEKKEYTLTRFCRGGGKLGYQITQRTHGDSMFDYVTLTKKDVERVLEKIEEDEE